MIVIIKRSGGFAGFEETLGTIDTGSLPNQTEVDRTISQLQHAIEDAESPFGMDMYRYDITIVGDDGDQQMLTIADDTDESNDLTRALYAVLDAFGYRS